MRDGWTRFIWEKLYESFFLIAYTLYLCFGIPNFFFNIEHLFEYEWTTKKQLIAIKKIQKYLSQ